MKSKTSSMSVILTSLFFACIEIGNANRLQKKPVLQAGTGLYAQETFRDLLPDSIDLSKLPFSEKELAAFPVFNPPTDIAPLNKPLARDFDRLFFPTKME